MYVDETGGMDSNETTDATSDAGHDVLTVEVGGEEYEVTENYDYDSDGDNDAAVVQTEDGYMAFHDTDGDGTADTMVELDAEGKVTGAAEYDEATGEWTAADPTSIEAPSGDGADGGTGGASGSDDTAGTGDTTEATDTSGDDATDTTGGGGEQMTVDTAEGDMQVGPAEYDSDGDGTNDTAIVTDEQGNTYAFVDSDGDGEADEAVVIEADGDVTVARHTAEDEWTTVETGQINADGTYTSDSANDAAWQS